MLTSAPVRGLPTYRNERYCGRRRRDRHAEPHHQDLPGQRLTFPAGITRYEARATTRLYLITPPALDPDRFAGVTWGDSRHRDVVAADAGADYVAFGAFFPSGTKAAKHRAQPDLLRDWSETTVVPCVAIGGITQANCGPLVEAGADFLSVIGAIWSYPRGPRAAVSEFNDVFARYGRAAA